MPNFHSSIIEPSHDKTNKMICAPSKDRSAWAATQSDQSLQCGQWVVESPMFLHVDSQDSDQTGRMPRLIRVFAGRKGHYVGFVMRRLILLQVKCEVSCNDTYLSTKIKAEFRNRKIQDKSILITFLLSSRTVFMFSIQTASTGPSNMIHFLWSVVLEACSRNVLAKIPNTDRKQCFSLVAVLQWT